METRPPLPTGPDESYRPHEPHGLRRLACAAITLCTALGAALGAGCSLPISPRGPLDTGALRHHDIDVVVAPPPSFYADNNDRRRFGFIGVFVMAHEGNRIARYFNIADPSIALAESLRRSISRMTSTGFEIEEGGPRAVSSFAAPSSTGVAVVPATPGAGRPDLTLRIQTTNWEYRPFQGHDDQFYVIYAARLDLVDGSSGRLLARERCEVSPTADKRLTEAALLADGARRLQAELAASSQLCLAMLREKPVAALLGLGPVVAHR